MTRPVTDVRTLGAAIRVQRLARGWTQADLADRAKVSRRFVGELEAGQRIGAELGRVFAVLRALGLAIGLIDRGTDSFDDTLSEVLR
jgi:HTH-type transcriptional regulator/antitoxin HipB